MREGLEKAIQVIEAKVDTWGTTLEMQDVVSILNDEIDALPDEPVNRPTGNDPLTLDEVKNTIKFMRKRFNGGQGYLSETMCRLSLPMSEFLLELASKPDLSPGLLAAAKLIREEWICLENLNSYDELLKDLADKLERIGK